MTCVISVEKLDNCLRLRLVNFPTFRLGAIFSPTREHYQRSYQLQLTSQVPQEEISENITIEESLTAQQQTLLRNEEKYLRIAPEEANVPRSLLFDEHAEKLSFPAIYLGHFRNFRERVTPFMIATSELRRVDHRGVTPQHLLYMAMKIMRLKE
ncbi:ATP-dependent DNA helicase [Trichonephila clavipes]|nr:ATP-dependent DNA helicase [Trichonephila clavipes]